MKMRWAYVDREATLEDVCSCVGPGWHDIIRRLVMDLEALGWDGSVMQVKEKFGTLRFYIGYGSDAVFDRIDEAEAESGGANIIAYASRYTLGTAAGHEFRPE
jgi:hypothetical protein